MTTRRIVFAVLGVFVLVGLLNFFVRSIQVRTELAKIASSDPYANPAISAIPVDGSTGAHSNPSDWCSSRRSVA